MTRRLEQIYKKGLSYLDDFYNYDPKKKRYSKSSIDNTPEIEPPEEEECQKKSLPADSVAEPVKQPKMSVSSRSQTAHRSRHTSAIKGSKKSGKGNIRKKSIKKRSK